MNKKLNVIAVDLTSFLKGEQDDWYKSFVLDLLSRLAVLAPQTRFILLTQATSHDELSVMDRLNMQRLMVLDRPVEVILERSCLQRFVDRIILKLRRKLLQVMSKLGHQLRFNNAATLLQKINTDLLFCPFTAPTYYETGIATVCTIYDLQYKTYPLFFAIEDVAYRNRIFTEACQRASALVTISDFTRDSVISHGKLDPANIRKIYPYMARLSELNVDNDKPLLASLKLTPERYIIYPANYSKHKNHEMLITAFGMACLRGLPTVIKLVCTGVPSERQAFLMSAVRAMKLADRVIFSGDVSNIELKTLMVNSIGVVFPSLYEDFCVTVIEAMALGVPVACSNLTSLPEVAGNAAILFDPRIPNQISDAIVSLVEDKTLRAQLVQTGYQRVADFSGSEQMARDHWTLFLSAFANVKH